jgi:hypothetical protein
VAFVAFGIALVGLGPLVVMQLRQVRQLEKRFDEQTTHYLAPSANRWARKLGAAAALQTTDPGTLAPSGAAFEVHLNFQRLIDPDPGEFEGYDYLPDGGAPFADRGNGYSYGWNVDNESESRNRNSIRSPDERYDTLTHTHDEDDTRTWEIAVPAGDYYVRLVSGDPSYTDSVYKINVEGVLTVDGTPSFGHHWIEGATTVSVSDGRLTITNAAGAVNNKICFVDIFPANQVSVTSVDKSLDAEEVTVFVEVTPR